MRVSLFVTCLADQLWPAAAVGAVEVLRAVGCDVEFDERQTCCGQPAFNTGYRPEARALARRTIEVFESSGADAIVSPSGSCTAMVHHYEQLFDDAGWRARARGLAERTHELSSFLVNRLGVEDVGASFSGRLTWHDACHGLRDLGVHDEPRRLLRHVRGAELVELPPPSAETCCGFGGTFAVKYPEISVAILDEKMEAIERARVGAVVSGDAGCLMQIGGRLSRRGSSVRTLHLAEVLASRASSGPNG
jgi:L-lactate dehydrogenase complex protein LldE